VRAPPSKGSFERECKKTIGDSAGSGDKAVGGLKGINGNWGKAIRGTNGRRPKVTGSKKSTGVVNGKVHERT